MNQTPPDQDSRPRDYVGGPGAATILGVNPWQTPLALWMYITGRAKPIEVNDAMRSGQRLERAVLDYAGEVLGDRVLPGPFLRDPTRPLGGHLDGVLEVARRQIVEAKTTRKRNGWGEPGTSEVPANVACQAEHYLGLADAEVCWVPVLFSGLEFAMYKVERDDALIRQMREICLDWWQRYVVTDTPPPPQTGADVLALFPRDTGRVVIASDAVADAVARLHQVRDMENALEEERDSLESQIKLELGDAATLTVAGEIAATWKASTSKRFDSAEFKKREPELYAAFCRPIEARRFLLKDMK